jgi:hypothetical protein
VLLSKVLLCDSNNKKKESSTKNQESRTNSPTSETSPYKNASSHESDNNKIRSNNNNNNNNHNDRNHANDGDNDNKKTNEKKEIPATTEISTAKIPELPLDPRDFDPHSTLHIVRQSMQDQPPKLIFSVCQALGSVGYVFLSEYVRGQNRKAWGNGNGVVGERNERKCVQCVQQITVILIAMLRHGVVKVRMCVCVCVCVVCMRMGVCGVCE